MTTLASSPVAGPASSRHPLTQPQLPRAASWLALVIALALGGLVQLLVGKPVLSVVVVLAVFVVGLPLWSAVVEGRRAASDRLASSLVYLAAAVVLVPLIWVLWLVVKLGSGVVNVDFLTYSMRSIFLVTQQGGLYHALLGTLIITGIAFVVAVPLGVLVAIYLVEYSRHGRASRTITFLVDVMTGIPSIVAGLFAYALVALVAGPQNLGISGALALILLMLPTVIRSTEEMLKLVPEDLREASYALGVPRWRTIVKVVIPTALGGIVTGIILAISRVIGETAPLLVAAGMSASVNTDPFHGAMMTLPLFIFDRYNQAQPLWHNGYTWGGALVLLILVVLLNLIARIIGRIFAPKSGR